MSKHLGNVLDPFELFDRHGADAVRWLMLAGGSPWMDRRVGHENVEEVVRKVLLTYYNTASFFLLYASTSDWAPGSAVPRRRRSTSSTGGPAASSPTPSPRSTPRSRTSIRPAPAAGSRRSSTTCRTGTCDAPAAASGRATRQALATLHLCLETVTRLHGTADPVPDRLALARGWRCRARPDSVHLAALADGPAAGLDAGCRPQVDLVRRLVELGRAARAGAKVKTRQPLARAAVPATLLSQLTEELRREIADELNVLVVEPLDGELVDIVGQAQLPGAGQAVRPAHQGRRRGRRDGRPPVGRALHRCRRRRGDRAVRRGADRHRDPAGRLGGGQRVGSVGGARPHGHRRAAPRRAGARRGAARAGGAQAVGARCQRPHRAVVAGRHVGAGGGDPRARRPGRRRGAGDELHRGHGRRWRSRRTATTISA